MTRTKRLTTQWIIEKKKYKFVISPKGSYSKDKTIPILVMMRDLLKLAKTSKESKHILNSRKIMVNGKICKNPHRGLGLFDVVSILDINQSYRILLKKVPYIIKIAQSESDKKICKIINKRKIKKGNVQLNLHDGRNIIIDNDIYSTNDSILIQLPDQQIIEHIKFEPNSYVFLTNKGCLAKIKDIEKGVHKKLILEDLSSKKVFESSIKNTIVVGKESPLISVGELNE